MINGINSINPLNNVQETRKSESAAKVRSTESDSISVSKEAEKMAEAYYLDKVAAETPDVRADRIAEVREKIKDPKSIINFEKLSIEDFYKAISQIKENLDNAFKKCKLKLNLPVYSLEKPENKIMKFEIDPQKFLNSNSINIYKLNLKMGTNILPLSNIVFFFNRNQTLPLGMDYSTEILVNLKATNLIKIKRKTNYIIKLSDVSPKQEKKEISITEYNI